MIKPNVFIVAAFWGSGWILTILGAKIERGSRIVPSSLIFSEE
jgi:hypothetical protein